MKRSSFFFCNFFLAVLGAIFFAGSHSNYFFLKGLPFLAYISLVPFFILIKRVSLKYVSLWGAFCGILSYFLFNFWIIFFHPLAVYIIIIQYAFVYACLFPVLKIADLSFPKYGFLAQSILWVGYEYIKTLGFTGYPYGIMGYTQWQIPFLVRTSSVFGVFGLSFLIVLFSAILSLPVYKAFFAGKFEKNRFQSFKISFFACKNFFIIWICLFLGFCFYGFFSYRSYENFPKKKIALVQPNRDPWIGNIEVYKQNFEDLKNLSERAMQQNEKPDLIVWSETAFVPRIKWHYKYPEDTGSSLLVRDLLKFINDSDIPFLIGNDDAVLKNETEPPSDDNRLDYNAALFFIPKKNVLPPEPDTYRKIHLVPFTEHFPYKNIFPMIYDFLEKNDTHFWEKGNDAVIFKLKDLRIGTPICFEDIFGYISAKFVKNNANLIINITNDAWASSLTAQYQHLGMAVFRAAENRVPLLRAAISGQTAYITPNGEIESMLEPFSSGFLQTEVPVLTKHFKTVYTVAGDFFGIGAVLSSFFLLFFAFFKRLKK